MLIYNFYRTTSIENSVRKIIPSVINELNCISKFIGRTHIKISDNIVKYIRIYFFINDILNFSMVDEVGNKTKILSSHEILVDSIPPNISNFIAPLSLKSTEESVVVDIGHWQGYLDSVNSVAITGSIKGKVKRVTVDGKAVTWDESNNIYQRMNLYIYGGLNKYKVVAEDMAGNISTGYVQTTAEKDNDELNVNLNEY